VPPAIGFGKLRKQQRQLDVLKRGQNGDEVIHLKNEADVARSPCRQFTRRHVRDFIAGHRDRSGRWNVQPSEQIEQRCFSRSAGTHECDEVSTIDIKVQSFEDVNHFAAARVRFIETAHVNQVR
jgi:hypothetical protein